MRRLLFLPAILWSPLLMAGVLNVEFKFAPFTGDLKAHEVQTVPGTARVYLNKALVAEQVVRKAGVPVLFEEREIAAPVWIPMASIGPALRKGRNHLRIEFVPDDPKSPYQGQLTWAQVTDQVTRSDDGAGTQTSSNQTGEGSELRPATGMLVFERDFEAPFAADRPWHHYPAITALSEAEKAELVELVRTRAAGFQPEFAWVYAVLATNPGLQHEEIRRMKCVDAAYAAGVRIAAVPAAEFEFDLVGPEVMLRGNKGSLYNFGDKTAFERIQGDDMQMCAGVVLSLAYPQRMAMVRNPDGDWEVAY